MGLDGVVIFGLVANHQPPPWSSVQELRVWGSVARQGSRNREGATYKSYSLGLISQTQANDGLM